MTLEKWQLNDPERELVAQGAKPSATLKEITNYWQRKTEHSRLERLCVVWNRAWYSPEPRPITDWYSNRSFIDALRTLTSFLWLLACLTALSVLLVLLAKTTNFSLHV